LPSWSSHAARHARSQPVLGQRDEEVGRGRTLRQSAGVDRDLPGHLPWRRLRIGDACHLDRCARELGRARDGGERLAAVAANQLRLAVDDELRREDIGASMPDRLQHP
jgi:hypothetical protein